MNDLIFIACGSGLQDGLNPCIFMTCAVFIAYGRWLNSSTLFITCLRVVFVLIYAVGILAFNFGEGPIIVLQKYFVLIARILYFVLGAGTFFTGVLFLKEWFLLGRGVPLKGLTGNKIKFLSLGGITMCLATVILVLILSALATLWPMNKYIIALGNESLLRGQWQSVLPMLVTYALVSMWPLWFVWSFISIKNLRPSLLTIVCSAIFFTASSCMIFIFQ
jgi:hypothetical protein